MPGLAPLQGSPARQRVATASVLTAALFVFGAIADELAEWGPFVSLDRHADEELHERATPWVTSFMEGVSWLGGSAGLTLVTITACGVLLARRRAPAAALVGLACVGAQVLSTLLKVEFARPRPSFAEPVVAPAGGYSFPSGHATASMAVYGALVYLVFVGVRQPVVKAVCVAAGTALVALIGFSRMYLGQHFPSDVIAGWAVALAWVAILLLSGSAVLALYNARGARSDEVPPKS